MSKVFAELRRRNVFRVALLYLVASWLVLQVADLAFDLLGIPQWGLRLVFAILALGLPFALAFSWVYEITPEGLKRESEIDRGRSIVAQTGRRLDIMTITIVTIVAAWAGIAYFARDRSSEQLITTGADRPTAAAPARDVSVAVLPFVNLSSDPADEYFSDGLAEELINAFAEIEGLKVSARTASFQFKNRTGDVAPIARQLKVANILQGSVRRAGNRVRIAAQLIEADNGFQLWSKTYDREMGDIFAVQSDIAADITRTLRLTLSTAPSAPTANVRAFELHLQGRHLWRRRNLAALEQSVKLLEESVRLDPAYAEAWATLAAAHVVLPDYSTTYAHSSWSRAEECANRAIALDARRAEPYAVLALVRARLLDWSKSEALFRRAIELEPGDATALLWLGQVLVQTGYVREGQRLLLEALEADPTSSSIVHYVAIAYAATGDYERGIEYANRAEALGSQFAPLFRGNMLLVKDDLAGAQQSWEAFLRNVGQDSGAARLVIDAIRDGSARPRALAGLDRLPAERFRYQSYILLGAHDRAATLFASVENPVATFLTPYLNVASRFRSSAHYKELVSHLRLVDFWRTRGWPDFCRPVGAADFECS